ncbi:MAG TPA: MDR family MFS transporter [Candidatus Limnocylindrales bacterium]|nr:MDR family MFS transporter [Candidatus Limnocylindrales bacterium]
MESFPMERDATPSLADDPALGLDRRAKFEILGAILLALFLGALDQTVVGTALPRIVTDLGGNDLYTWVVTIYLLTSTITVPFYGKLSDLYGRKPMLIFGITTFLIGSALSGLSQDMTQLILFRGIQGVGAGSLFPIALAVIGDLFTPAERGKYQGLFGAVFGVSFLVGPALGGFLTDNISWHWVFYVNLPIGIISLFVIFRLLPNIRRPDASRNLDYLGALLFTVAISLILVGLTNKIDQATFTVHEWTEFGVGGLIGIGAILLLAFLFVESRAKEPIVPLDLWRNRTYVSSMLATFLASFGFFGAVIFIPRWFQVVRGESATASGYLMFPLLIGLIGSSIISGQIVARTHRYKALIIAALAIMAVGVGLMTQLTATTDFPVFFLWMFITGVGIGPTLAVFTIVVQNAVPFHKLGVATSNLTFFRQIGGSVGLAIAGTAFASGLQEKLPGQLAPVIDQIKASVPPAFQSQFDQLAGGGGGNVDFAKATGVGQSFGQAISDAAAAAAAQAGAPAEAVKALFAPHIHDLDLAFFNAFSLAIGQTFMIGVATAIVAAIVSFGMKEIPLRTSFGPSPAPESAAEGAPTAGPAATAPGAAASTEASRPAGPPPVAAKRPPNPATD